jgi:prepilin-type processing-associated H-X9-DG protein
MPHQSTEISDMTTFPCPSCGKTISAETFAGSPVTCPFCGNKVTAPGPETPARRGLAIASLVLGILGIFTSCLPVLGLTALALGIIALAKASRRPMEYGGKGLAIAGVCLGGLSLLLMPMTMMAVTMFVPAVSKARNPAGNSVLATNMENTRKALEAYIRQHHYQCPPEVEAILRSSDRDSGMALAIYASQNPGQLPPQMEAILLSSLAKARELPKRSVCAANLAGIGKAIEVYARQYKDTYPPEMDVLVTTGLVQPSQFVCPSTLKGEDRGDTEITYNTGEPVSRELHEILHDSYVYIPGQKYQCDPENVLIYEKRECHHGEGGNVLFMDGHAQWIAPYSRIEELVIKTKARLASGTRLAPKAESP